jgi:2-keto-4-pentenoate hydratase/2-oxohepta-3-ene-1,7-dioic acid hydratase in catechol pathway
VSQSPPAIICIGRNYLEHARELGHEVEENPIIFFKNPATLCGARDEIRLPDICHDPMPQVDFEGELAVLIARDVRDVTVEEALDHVGGYAVANDVSARWWQKHGSGGQYCRGKSFDTFCPITPFVSADSVPDPQNLELKTWLNGELMQSASTSMMMFSVATLIAELSRGMTLLAGTYLLTGTPAGVGAGRDPKVFLKAGDLVEIEIQGVGRLENPVVSEA